MTDVPLLCISDHTNTDARDHGEFTPLKTVESDGIRAQGDIVTPLDGQSSVTSYQEIITEPWPSSLPFPLFGALPNNSISSSGSILDKKPEIFIRNGRSFWSVLLYTNESRDTLFCKLG